MLRVKLFGIGRVLDGDTEVKLRSRNWTLPLLAYVVLHRAETIPRWRLAFTMWPDETEESALQNLRRNLHLLMKALPRREKPWLLVDVENIAWNATSEFQLDVAEYERLRADPATLEEAVALYGGDLLEEVYDDWVTAERERMRQLYHTDLTALIVANRRRRAFGAAIYYARRLLAADAWREDTLRQLMAARYESGDAAGALAEFDRFAHLLRVEMNAEPMQETVALREAIARGVPIPGTSDAPKSLAKRVALATPFVGRERELTQLRGYWGHAASGGGGLVLVRGDAGIGKSRLVSELALIVEAEGGRVIEGATSSPERGPYECVAEALRQGLVMIAALPLPLHILAAVADLVPELRARRPDLPTPAHLDERSERIRLFDALGQAVVQLARPRPVLVILEDVQWADAATIELIRALALRISRSSILTIATYRDEQPVRPHVLHALERGTAGAARPGRVVIGPLDASAIARLAETIAPAGSIDPDWARRIFQRSEGNPLFATEMLRDAARGAYDPSAIPTNVGALIATRIAALSPAAQVLAQVAAMVGAAFAFDVVREATGFSDAQMLDGLDELLDRHLVRESTERMQYEYAFTHDLVRQAIYDQIPPAVRGRRHLRIGRVLENAYPNRESKPAGEIGGHYERGGNTAAAAKWYLIAAQRAAALYANAEARDLATRALQLGPSSDRVRFDLLLVRQEMNVRLGERHKRQADLIDLASLSSQLDEEAAFVVLRLNVDFAHDWGKIAEESVAIARFRQRAESSGSGGWLAIAMELQARGGLRESDTDRALESALAAQALYQHLGDAAGQVRAATLASGACTGADRSDDAIHHVDDARRIAAGTGDPSLRLFVLGAAVAQSYESQQYARSAEFSQEMLQISNEIGHRSIEYVARGNLASALWHLWQVDEALAHFKAAIAVQESIGLIYGSALLNNFAGLLSDLGDFNEALRTFERAESMAKLIGRPIHVLEATNDSAQALWQRGDIEPMRRAVERASRLAQGLGKTRLALSVARNRGRMLRWDGGYDESAAVLESILEVLRSFHRPVDEIVATDELAATYLAAHRLLEAVATVEASSALALRLEDPRAMQNPVAHHWIAACVYRANGETARAASGLSAAETVYLARRDAISDASLRASFEAIPLHRALHAALQADAWPPASDVMAPRVTVPDA